MYETCNLSPIKLKLHHFVAHCSPELQISESPFRQSISLLSMIDSSSLLARSTSSVTCGPDLVSEEGIENENRFVTVQNRFFFDH